MKEFNNALETAHHFSREAVKHLRGLRASLHNTRCYLSQAEWESEECGDEFAEEHDFDHWLYETQTTIRNLYEKINKNLDQLDTIDITSLPSHISDLQEAENGNDS